MAVDINWRNKSLDEFPQIFVNDERFPYAIQGSKVNIMDYGQNTVVSKKYDDKSFAFSEQIKDNGAKVGIPVYQTPAVREYVKSVIADGAFTFKLIYPKAGYVEKMSSATFQDIPTGQGGETVELIVEGSSIVVERTI